MALILLLNISRESRVNDTFDDEEEQDISSSDVMFIIRIAISSIGKFVFVFFKLLVS